MTSLTKTFKNLNWKLVKKYRTSLKYTLALGSLAFVLYIFFIIKMLNSTEKIVFYPNMCHIYPNELIKMIKLNENVSDTDVENELAPLNIRLGGKWYPNITENSNSRNEMQVLRRDRVAIIIPYRNRPKNLRSFMRYIHQFLTKQNVDYGIYLIEPNEGLQFNRAYLLNIGFMEALKDDPKWTCFIFHDVDLLPENDFNFYQCQDLPTQFAITVNIYNYTEQDYFKNRYLGGVTTFSKEQFTAINGYSNSYFGWGGEDDDAYQRCMKVFGKINRLNPQIGRYFANCHNPEEPNSERETLLKNSVERMSKDGLNSLNYNVHKLNKAKLFTHVFIYY